MCFTEGHVFVVLYLLKRLTAVHAKKILTNLRSSICKRLMVNNTCRKKFIQNIKTTIKKTNMS